MATTERMPIAPRIVEQVSHLGEWEYALQLAFHTADLHIVRAWALDPDGAKFKLEALAEVNAPISEGPLKSSRASPSSYRIKCCSSCSSPPPLAPLTTTAHQ
eukprot:GHVU01027307.1.p2 GENE.GHVU01027307.1~~GHVU01027307.1.p2  ORF type:complete len:102 (+),score=11.87 GHVU01027307.1:744-1049(+)